MKERNSEGRRGMLKQRTLADRNNCEGRGIKRKSRDGEERGIRRKKVETLKKGKNGGRK